MPPGPGMFNYLNRQSIKRAIDDLPHEKRDFAQSISSLVMDYLECREQIPPLGIFIAFMTSPLVSKIIYGHFHLSVMATVLMSIAIFVFIICLTFFLRKGLLNKIKRKIIEKCNSDTEKLKIAEKLYEGKWF